jgi:hypothetical protein
MFLKMEKAMIGIRKVKFFEYECENGNFRIDERRRTDMQAIPAPITVVICSGFIIDYSTRAIPLYNMTTFTYDWSNAWPDKESCSLHSPHVTQT